VARYFSVGQQQQPVAQKKSVWGEGGKSELESSRACRSFVAKLGLGHESGKKKGEGGENGFSPAMILHFGMMRFLFLCLW
jgi:hypothetical protein